MILSSMKYSCIHCLLLQLNVSSLSHFIHLTPRGSSPVFSIDSTESIPLCTMLSFMFCQDKNQNACCEEMVLIIWFMCQTHRLIPYLERANPKQVVDLECICECSRLLSVHNHNVYTWMLKGFPCKCQETKRRLIHCPNS